ncbi:hypothetical protein NPIL_568431 [Nephila pilipes]|uniref:Uncharacterized protein n=1 Tax=Nephila pilipes TaxID=299642 RepID=A0A8X6QH02_NEPPI|nr:hypothetical protein NPIL_568431 [Nephila pilipes]
MGEWVTDVAGKEHGSGPVIKPHSPGLPFSANVQSFHRWRQDIRGWLRQGSLVPSTVILLLSEAWTPLPSLPIKQAEAPPRSRVI